MCDIRFADVRDREALCRIWSAVFTEDTPEERDAFLNTVRLSEECVVACENGEPISMAFFIPAVLRVQGTPYAVRYLYAAATLPAYRGNGIFSDLLNKALVQLKESGNAACLLNPAQPSLVGYYERFGFQPMFFSRTLSGSAAGEDVRVSPLSADAFLSLRQRLLPPDRVEWDERLLSYVMSYAEPIRIGEHACALCVKNGNTLRVLELSGIPYKESTAVCGALARHYGCDAFCARIYSKTGDCFGMLVPLKKDIPIKTAPYMGLAFD